MDIVVSGYFKRVWHYRNLYIDVIIYDTILYYLSYLIEPGGHIDCHLSAKVDTIGGLLGLFSKILSISATIFAFSFGTNCKD